MTQFGCGLTTYLQYANEKVWLRSIIEDEFITRLPGLEDKIGGDHALTGLAGVAVEAVMKELASRDGEIVFTDDVGRRVTWKLENCD